MTQPGPGERGRVNHANAIARVRLREVLSCSSALEKCRLSTCPSLGVGTSGDVGGRAACVMRAVLFGRAHLVYADEVHILAAVVIPQARVSGEAIDGTLCLVQWPVEVDQEHRIQARGFIGVTVATLSIPYLQLVLCALVVSQLVVTEPESRPPRKPHPPGNLGGFELK